MTVAEYPVCPHCDRPVRSDPHELLLQLVNAGENAPEESTRYHAVFHHECAVAVWNAAREEWFAGRNVAV